MKKTSRFITGWRARRIEIAEVESIPYPGNKRVLVLLDLSVRCDPVEADGLSSVDFRDRFRKE